MGAIRWRKCMSRTDYIVSARIGPGSISITEELSACWFVIQALRKRSNREVPGNGGN